MAKSRSYWVERRLKARKACPWVKDLASGRSKRAVIRHIELHEPSCRLARTNPKQLYINLLQDAIRVTRSIIFMDERIASFDLPLNAIAQIHNESVTQTSFEYELEVLQLKLASARGAGGVCPSFLRVLSFQYAKSRNEEKKPTKNSTLNEVLKRVGRADLIQKVCER
jgi:hypothetical protein